ncbi:unnamed protein product [Coregonus sp. 'balchen']|nr:unnamed protein product [Coregonus sp. 'balchen']
MKVRGLTKRGKFQRVRRMNKRVRRMKKRVRRMKKRARRMKKRVRSMKKKAYRDREMNSQRDSKWIHVDQVLHHQKGYQSSDTAVGSVLTKMKGVGYTNVAGEERIWDVADYVFPVQGDSSFVVMTNYIITKGHTTGKCLVDTTKMCEVLAWCPVEDDSTIPDPALLMSAENYTLFIKNSISFPAYGVTSCLYDPKKSPLCPIFRLGDLVQLSGFNFSTIARVGGAIGIVIDWTCNLDYDQYAKHYMEDKQEKRTLLKVFGIRFDIIVRSLARKFDIIPTLTAIGSGVGIFGVATVVCDLILLYLLPKREFYNNMKFKVTESMEKRTADSWAPDCSDGWLRLQHRSTLTPGCTETWTF